jgi:hypothetical protein
MGNQWQQWQELLSEVKTMTMNTTKAKAKKGKRKFVFGMKKDRQLDGDKMNSDFMKKVVAEGGKGAAIAACMQCGTCSGVVPILTGWICPPELSF